MLKNPPMQQIQETQVRSLAREDPLEEGMATHPSILAWRIPRTEEPGGLQSMGSQGVRHDYSDFPRRTKPRQEGQRLCDFIQKGPMVSPHGESAETQKGVSELI